MRVLIGGDFCDHKRVSKCIALQQYGQLFDGIKDKVQMSDYSILNFEFPIVKEVAKPIKKCGPNLSGQLNSVEALKYAGFKCCTLANNHILDQGVQCGIETKEIIENNGIDTVGFGRCETDAACVLYKVINGHKLAIINCCEHEFSVAAKKRAGSNGLDPIRMFYSIKEAKNKSDFLLVIIHGGHEHFNLPSIRMQEAYRFFIDLGADVVINHHQHCFSGYEVYKNKPIFYGLGNLLFDHPNYRNSFWNQGFLVSINFEIGSITYEIIPYNQCNDKPGIFLLDGDEKQLFNEKLDYLNNVISSSSLLEQEVNKYYQSNEKSSLFNLQPYSGKLCSKLWQLGLIPSLLNEQKLINILNHIDCEAHRDMLLYSLKKSLCI